METANGGFDIAPIEIVPPLAENGIRILGEQVKKEDSEGLRFIQNPDLKSRLRDLALDSFTKLGARGFGRIDIKSTSDGRLYFMEANLVPGMTKGSSYFPRAFEIEHQYGYKRVVQMILNSGLAKSNHSQSLSDVASVLAHPVREKLIS